MSNGCQHQRGQIFLKSASWYSAIASMKSSQMAREAGSALSQTGRPRGSIQINRDGKGLGARVLSSR